MHGNLMDLSRQAPAEKQAQRFAGKITADKVQRRSGAKDACAALLVWQPTKTVKANVRTCPLGQDPPGKRGGSVRRETGSQTLGTVSSSGS